MKLKILVTLVLLLSCISFVLMSCVQKDYNEVQGQDYNRCILEEKSLSLKKQPTFIEFKGELEDYKAFSDELFPIWLDHINKTSATLEDFNSSTIFEEKIKKSRILEQDYLEFKVNLEKLKPPSIAAGAYDLAVEAVSCRILFFEKFNENAPVDELNKIESTAYVAETGFWAEIDEIYKYFDKEISRVGAMPDNRYLAFN